MTTKIDPKGGVTRYLQLYAALSQELADGGIDPGALMPSEPSLVRKYRVSRTTVRRALARLESEGKIVRRRGSGTFAVHRPESPLRPGERVSQVEGRAESRAESPDSRQLDVHWVETPALVQKSMQGFGPSCLMSRTLRLIHGQPFALATSYVAAPEPPSSGKAPASSRAFVEGMINPPAQRPAELAASTEQIVTAVGADAFTARQLGIPAGAPLLQVRRLHYDADHRPLEYEDVRYRADLFELRMVMAQDGQTSTG